MPVIPIVVCVAGYSSLLLLSSYLIYIKFPYSLNLSSIEGIKDLVKQVSNESLEHKLALYCSLYLFKMSFSFPGALLLNLMGGYLFQNLGTLLAIILNLLGSIICFLLSTVLSGPLVESSSHIKMLKNRVFEEKRKKNLFFYLLFLRMFPLTPNWLLNLLLPHCGVNLFMFSCTILIGQAPYNIIFTQAGIMLSSIESIEDLNQTHIFLKLAALALLALAPKFIRSN